MWLYRSSLPIPIVALSLTAGVVAFSFWGTIGRPDCMDLDFGAYYRAGQAVADGRSLYFVDEHGPLGTYPYAPIFAFLLSPFAQLDYLWACRLWLLMNWLALAACCVLALRHAVNPASSSKRMLILALALVPIAAY